MKAHDLTVSLDSWPTFEGDARWWFRIGERVLASGKAADVAAGKLAAETAARQYADAIRAALPSPAAPGSEAVERVVAALRGVAGLDDPNGRMSAGRMALWCDDDSAWRKLARLAIAAGLDPSRLEKP